MESNGCVFCAIVEGREKAAVVFEDDTLIAFRDIHPDAEIHIQLIPKQHIANINALGEEHRELIYKMEATAQEILKEALGPTREAQMKKTKLGFHVPPYNSVNHLHMHLLAGRFAVKSYLTHNSIFPWFMPLPELKRKLGF